jgi:uncharacterized membrane protein
MIRTYDFPGRGVGAIVYSEGSKVVWVGIHLTGMDGHALLIEATPEPKGGFALIRRFGQPVSQMTWPRETGEKRAIGEGTIAIDEAAGTIEMWLTLTPADVGKPPVDVSPPAPPYISVRLYGFLIA